MIQQQQSYFLELYRAGVRTASDIAKATLENAHRLQAQQAEIVRQAIDVNARSAQNAAEFWTRAWRTASETQVAVLGQVQQQVGELSERARETAHFAQSAVNYGAEAERKSQQHRRTA